MDLHGDGLALIAKNLDKEAKRIRASLAPRGSTSGRSSGSVPSSPALASIPTPIPNPIPNPYDELENFSLRAPSSEQLNEEKVNAVQEQGKKKVRNKPPPPGFENKVFEKKPELSKAERRAKQEAERAAKSSAGSSTSSAISAASSAPTPDSDVRKASAKPTKPVIVSAAPATSASGTATAATAASAAVTSSAKPLKHAAVSAAVVDADERHLLLKPPPPTLTAATAAISSPTLGAVNAKKRETILKQTIALQHDDASKMAKQSRQAIIARVEVVAARQIPSFAHLPQYTRLNLIAVKLGFHLDDIHPSIVRLGLKYAEGAITGAIARCVAFIRALQDVIQDYECPPLKNYAQELITFLNKYAFRFLVNCRPLSATMGATISYLKRAASQLSPQLSNEKSKEAIIKSLENFIEERIKYADLNIVERALPKIFDGDIILTYAHSHVIELILKAAKTKGLRFQVIVVDSRPKFEGKELTRRLVAAGIDCSYVLLNGVAYAMQSVSKVFLGAAALLSNGTALSRAGTAIVAMIAHSMSKPVMLCCETIKFSDRVQLDSICSNELGDPDELLEGSPVDDGSGNDLHRLAESDSGVKLLNLVYDLTPAHFISMVISDVGLIPPTSVPVVIREYKRERI